MINDNVRIRQYVDASQRYLATNSASSLEFDFPNIKQCPICDRKDCACRKGYYVRQAIIPEIGYRGDIVIAVFRCKTTKRYFSLLPSFLFLGTGFLAMATTVL